MKLFNQKSFTQNIQAIGGSKDLTLYYFGGTVPTSQGEFPFDLNEPADIYKNCIGACKVNDADHAYGIKRYDFTEVAYPCKGYAEPLDVDNQFRVVPSEVALSTILQYGKKFLPSMLTCSRHSYERTTYSPYTNEGTDTENMYIEYTFESEISLATLAFQNYIQSSYRPTNLLLQMEVEGVWTTVEEIETDLISKNVRVEYVLENQVVASKFRLVYSNYVSTVSVIGVEFFADVEPVSLNVETPITWFLLVPETDGVSFVNYPRLGSRVPAIWGSAGGPNDEADLALTSSTAVPGDFIKSLNLKMQVQPIGELK